MSAKVSIVVTAYNKAQTLDQCLISACKQTYADKEIICVDDGSTDRSRFIAYKHHSVKVIRQANAGQEHGSGGPARNTGIAASTGVLILPLDGDDWIEPTYLEKTVPLMERREIGMVCTDMHRFGAIDDVIRAEKRALEQQLRSNQLPVTSLFRKSALIEAGGYWQYGWEDCELTLKLLENGWQMEVVNEPLFHYRVGTSGLNDRQTKEREQLRIRMREAHPGFAG